MGTPLAGESNAQPLPSCPKSFPVGRGMPFGSGSYSDQERIGFYSTPTVLQIRGVSCANSGSRVLASDTAAADMLKLRLIYLYMYGPIGTLLARLPTICLPFRQPRPRDRNVSSTRFYRAQRPFRGTAGGPRERLNLPLLVIQLHIHRSCRFWLAMRERHLSLGGKVDYSNPPRKTFDWA